MTRPPTFNAWHPSAGVTQVSVHVGGRPQVSLLEAIALFESHPDVKSAGATPSAWRLGIIDLTLNTFCHEVPPALRGKLVAICHKVTGVR